MPDRVDPAARLRAIGQRDTPPLDPARLASIESRVLTTARDTNPVQPTREVLAGYGRNNLTRWGGVAAVVIVLAVVGGALLSRGTGDGLVIEAAEGVVIDAAGNEPATAAPGDRVVDGAIVEIAPSGSATISGIAYGPGRYVVDGGALRPLAPEPPATGDDRDAPASGSTTTTTSTTTTSTTTTTTMPPPAHRPPPTAPDTSTRVPATEPRATRPPPTSSTSTSRPERSTTTTTTTSAPVRTTTTVSERATTSRPATTTSTTSPRRP